MQHIRVFGAEGGRPLLALHCSLAHGGAWDALARALPDLRVTAPDLPGHGRTGPLLPGQDLLGEATWQAISAAEVLVAAQGGPIDLIGHSFGGVVALRLALERPELVQSLVLVEPVLFSAARAAGAPEYHIYRKATVALEEALGRGDREAAAAAFLGDWGDGTAFANLPPHLRQYTIDRMHLIPAQHPGIMEDNGGLLVWQRLESLGLPVLLVEGADSPPVIHAIHDELARRLPQVARLRILGAGHMLPLTHASELAAAVAGHFAAA